MFFVGISVGLLLSLMIQFIIPNETMSVATIETEAKKLGMDYPSEFKISNLTTEDTDSGDLKEEGK